MTIKELFERVEKRKQEEKTKCCLSIELGGFEVYNLNKDELVILLREAIYLLGDDGEEKLIENIKEWNEELF